MIDLLKQYLSGQPSSQHLNATREYLQWVVLQTLDDAGYRSRLCFTGGTCLRGELPRLFLVNHFSLPSLFATKVHALLFRGFDKGRDYYDLFFFLRKKTEPDRALFRSAVKQTHPKMDFPNRLSVISAIRSKLETMDEKAILKDVGPFLLDPSEARFLRKDVLLKSLSQAYP
jgi:predicted nucleotidyltransferase component of viral defense system